MRRQLEREKSEHNRYAVLYKETQSVSQSATVDGLATQSVSYCRWSS
jgi:hypothetical protein